MDAVILAGGRGERLKSVTEMPKSLIYVCGRPFIEWILDLLYIQGIKKVVICTNNQVDLFKALLEPRDFMDIIYSVEYTRLGTAGAIKYALPYIHSDRLLVLNGDSYTRFSLPELVARHERSGADGTLWLVKPTSPNRFGGVATDSSGKIISFVEKPSMFCPRISAGVYLLETQLIKSIAGSQTSLELDIFSSGNNLASVTGDETFLDIGVPDDLYKAPYHFSDEFNKLLIESHAYNTAETLKNLPSLEITNAAKLIVKTFSSGHKLLVCGNGGSAADSGHFVAEFVNRLSKSFERKALPALSLSADTSVITAISNDYDYEFVFSRQVEALGNPGDTLFVISTSGRSSNVIKAIRSAKDRNMSVVALTGDNNDLPNITDVCVKIRNSNTQTLQEVFLTVEHVICGIVEKSGELYNA